MGRTRALPTLPQIAHAKAASTRSHTTDTLTHAAASARGAGYKVQLSLRCVWGGRRRPGPRPRGVQYARAVRTARGSLPLVLHLHLSGGAGVGGVAGSRRASRLRRPRAPWRREERCRCRCRRRRRCHGHHHRTITTDCLHDERCLLRAKYKVAGTERPSPQRPPCITTNATVTTHHRCYTAAVPAALAGRGRGGCWYLHLHGCSLEDCRE